MLRDYYKQMSDELKKIKKEGKIENIEIEEMNEENGYEDVEINYPQNKKLKTSMLKKGIIATAAAVCLGTGLSSVPVPEDNVQVVEAAAKKDKKKPVIKFSGKSKMTVEKNKSVKIPKTTAKDNKDGNVTKKLKVTVKKGKKSYSKIAKAIKSNKKVKFTSTGKYVITYTVTDKAGNKATKKRYVTVVNKNSNDYNLTTEEQINPVEYDDEGRIICKTDLSKLGKITQKTINGVTYNFVDGLDLTKINYDMTGNSYKDKFKVKFEYFGDEYNNRTLRVATGLDSKYNNYDNLILYLVGDIKAIDDKYNYSKNIILDNVITETSTTNNVYLIDNNNNIYFICSIISYNKNNDDKYNWYISDEITEDMKKDMLIDETNQIVVIPKPNINIDTIINKQAKALVLK